MPDINDPRIDPRIRALFGAMPLAGPQEDATDRDTLVAEANSEEALARMEGMTAMFEAADNETIAPMAGLTMRTEKFT